MNVAVIGTGNVGVAISADLSIKGHDVTLIKSSETKSEAFDLLRRNNNRVYLKEDGCYTETRIKDVTKDVCKLEAADVVFITIQSTYHEQLIKTIGQYLSSRQVVVIVCSYMASFYISQYCRELPNIAEATGPYLEGRTELNDKAGEVVFRVGCRLTKSPLSVFDENRRSECMRIIKRLYQGFCDEYSVIESALLNPNMVLHTVGSIMSIPRIEYSKGNFCMYREAYARGNNATMNIMLALDEEKKSIMKALGARPIDIMEAGGFLKGKDSFYEYSESSDRAISPTSVRSRYITEDVSQGLVLLESIADRIGVPCFITTALIDITIAALNEDLRSKGRTVKTLLATNFIDHLREKWYGVAQ